MNAINRRHHRHDNSVAGSPVKRDNLSCKFIALIAILFSFGAFAAEISRQTIQKDGKSYQIQKFTLECNFKGIGRENHGWVDAARVYTVHIADYTKTSWTSPDTLGYYSWREGEWLKFADINSNYLVMQRQNLLLGTEAGCVGERERECPMRNRQTYIYADDYTLKISRTTLTAQSEYRLRCTTNYMWAPECIAFDEQKWQNPTPVGQCRLIEYQKPPESLGF